LRQPSNRTQKDDSRIEISNLVIVLIIVALLPVFLFVILNNALLVLGVEFLFLVGFIDLTLTADMINRGYREQNFYNIFLVHLGNKVGFRITILINFAIRAAICIAFSSYPTIILVCSLATFFGPVWNTLHAYSFRDDIVLQMPTKITIGTQQFDLDAGNKKRLEQQKDGSDLN
jgi:hypothetical protein